MIKVTSDVKIYEVAGKEENEKTIKIHSHWNRNEMVNIEFPGFGIITVCAKDIEAAICNAKNSARF